MGKRDREQAPPPDGTPEPSPAEEQMGDPPTEMRELTAAELTDRWQLARATVTAAVAAEREAFATIERRVAVKWVKAKGLDPKTPAPVVTLGSERFQMRVARGGIPYLDKLGPAAEVLDF